MRYRKNKRHARANIYHEEIAAEMICSPYRRDTDQANNRETGNLSKLAGFVALFLSLLSFFIAPFVCAVVAIIIGFFAQRIGEIAIGAWAIGISALSIILAIFIIPLF
ncbi:DUF4190 domain-containing protein [Bacillus sp. AGMB 02131]|uniref:DUF4190 domain-containing protein n=1 Tax=Peribacillus faecalis TaxID=2772559 RepID=A0A927CX69_9BACI|nr:DUF4190 domain-containing protein [Peribacillus faecalis]MBD3107605.1 DUF4190 domain-containing protein [Peribacillus faecalis]